MSLSRLIPRIADKHNQNILRSIRRSTNRYVTIYLAGGPTQTAIDAGWDTVSQGPIAIDAVNQRGAGSFTYTTVTVPCRVVWGDANMEDNALLSGNIKEGSCTIYVDLKDSAWLRKSMNNEQSYCTVDGLKMKVNHGPVNEGIAEVQEHSYWLVQYSRDGLYDATDGAVQQGR